jgi:putative DNA primase/helicase
MTAKILNQFREEMKTHCLDVPGDLIADGKWQRCNATNKEHGHGKNDGRYVLHLDGVPCGLFINYTIDSEVRKWVYKRDQPLTDVEQRELAEKIKRNRREASVLLEKERTKARVEAKQLWDKSKPAWEQHPYCKRKGVRPTGLKMERRDSASPLLVPVYDKENKLVNIQFIETDGRKHCITGGPLRDCHYWIVKPNEVRSKTILVGEGWATAKSTHDATKYAAIMCFGKDNLLSVAKWVRKQYPDHKIILLADDDGGEGIAKANEAARAVDGLVAKPEFGKRSNFSTV